MRHVGLTEADARAGRLILFFLPRRGRSLGGATMSLEGGLEEFDEFFLRRAIELLMALLGQSVSLSYLEYLRDQAR